MSKTHIVEEGDGIDSIAFENGFAPDTLWQHPLNAGLKSKRVDGNVLLPGDQVQIPDKDERREQGETSQRHIMKRRGVPSKFKLQLFHNHLPRANQSWQLDVEGKKYQGQTDGSGAFEIFIDPLARSGTLIIGPDHCTIQLQLGGLDPKDEAPGYEKRLRNLDVLQMNGHVRQEWNLENALRAFQFMKDLEITGKPDAATLAELAKMHDTPELMPWNEQEEANRASA